MIGLSLVFLYYWSTEYRSENIMNFLQKKTWFLGFIGLMLLTSCKQESPLIYPNTRVIQLGDDMAWADPQFDDSDWDKSGSTSEIGRFWVRCNINFDDRINELNHKGIHMISLGSYEAYWDGVLIHENGKVGTSKENEIEGQFMSQILIPDSLCQLGSHVLALRLSSYHKDPHQSPSWNTFKVEEYKYSVKKELQVTALMFILGGCFLLVSLYYLLLFVKEKRDLTTLVFSVICMLFFALIFFEYLKFYWSYPYSFHEVRLIIIGSLTGLLTFVVPLFICLHFDIPHRRIILTGLFITLAAIALVLRVSFDSTAILCSVIMLSVSILLSAYACLLNRKGSVLILLAFLVVAVINYLSTFDFELSMYNYDINLFLSFLILVLTILYSLSQQRQEQKQAYEASLLLSERLKNELIKKNIQPHFIMNTLTSVMEWIELSPQKSIEFIEALAGEFDLLNDMADEKLIPISQEIDLCKKHLEIMTYRKEVTYLWEDENIIQTHKIPPAILHTIIENGITHSKAPVGGQIKFKLTQVNDDFAVIYKLEVFAENRETKTSLGSGTGFKYIRSRLTESYGDGWDLKSGATPTGWLTEISIHK